MLLIARIELNKIIWETKFFLFISQYIFLFFSIKSLKNKLPEELDAGASRVVWLQTRVAQWVFASFLFIASSFPPKRTQSSAWLSGLRLQFYNFSTVCWEEIEMQNYIPWINHIIWGVQRKKARYKDEFFFKKKKKRLLCAIIPIPCCSMNLSAFFITLNFAKK